MLNDLILGVIDFTGWELRGSDIQIVFHQGSDECEVYANRVQIEQVLINLVRNSLEAISSAEIRNGQIDIASQTGEDNMVEVTVADNGPGISAAVAEVLFEPYQTSKEAGMGMGLSISRSIVEAHNGSLSVDGQQTRGALFCMRLPRCG